MKTDWRDFSRILGGVGIGNLFSRVECLRSGFIKVTQGSQLNIAEPKLIDTPAVDFPVESKLAKFDL